LEGVLVLAISDVVYREMVAETTEETMEVAKSALTMVVTTVVLPSALTTEETMVVAKSALTMVVVTTVATLVTATPTVTSAAILLRSPQMVTPTADVTLKPFTF